MRDGFVRVMGGLGESFVLSVAGTCNLLYYYCYY